MKKTKIICTIGPSSISKEILKKMIEEGMNVARINLSHADYDFSKRVIKTIRELNEELGTNVAILVDTKGPEVRIGNIKNGKVKLNKNDEIRISSIIEGNKEEISFNHMEILENIELNDKILLDDGSISLNVERKNKGNLVCRVENDGVLCSKKGVNIPHRSLNIPFLSDKDKEDIEFACENDVDFIALSFVSTAEDVLEVNDLMIEKNNNHIQLIAKIENEFAISNIDKIIKVSDGIMVARGDLGVEVPLEKLPGIQKDIIERCHEANKISIVAAQMLQSMQDNPLPTRAEVSDIHNAVLDGTDAIMLSGETTIGEYPIQAVNIMAKIAESAEYEINYLEMLDRAIRDEKHDITCAISSSVVDSAYRLKANVIVASTNTGYTARKISHFRPICPIIATTPNEKTARSLALNWGVHSVVVNLFTSTDEIVDNAKEVAKNVMKLETGDIVIVTGGFPLLETKQTNFMKIEKI